MPRRPAKCLPEEGVKVESNSGVLRPPVTRGDTGALPGRTMGRVAVTAGLFGIGAYLGPTDESRSASTPATLIS
jgi:hypothetical protein